MCQIKIIFVILCICAIAISNSSANYAWQDAIKGVIPADAVIGGYKPDKTPVYVGRVKWKGDWLVGEIWPKRNAVYFTADGVGYVMNCCWQYLVGKNFDWVRDYDGLVPLDAVNTREENHSIPNYVGRVYHDKSLIVGYIDSEEKALLVPDKEKSYAFENYEILVNLSCDCEEESREWFH